MPTNFTQLGVGSGGDAIYDEDLGGGIKMPATKIHTGSTVGTDGGPVSTTNPFPVSATNFNAAALLADGTANPTIVQIQNYAMLYNGATWDRQRVSNVFTQLSAIAISGTSAALWTPSGKKFRLIRAYIATVAAGTLTLLDSASAFAIFYLAANSPIAIDLGPNGYISTATSNALNATFTSSTTISGTLVGTTE